MPKKAKPYLWLSTLERYCKDARELIFFMKGYFKPFTLEYEKMSTNEINRKIEELKVCFDFLERFKKNE